MKRTVNQENWDDFEMWMEKVNAAQWATMSERIVEPDLTDKTVLDFGCNRGVSLRVLYSKKPFAYGYGIDDEPQAIEIAQQKQGNLPVTYEVRDNIEHLNGKIDVAFSHETIYVLEDLPKHAKEMFHALKDHGVYYVGLSAHPENPVWEGAKAYMMETLGLEPQNYTLYDIAEVFAAQGFTVQARQFDYNDFLVIEPEGKKHLPSILELLKSYREYKILFRFAKG